MKLQSSLTPSDIALRLKNETCVSISNVLDAASCKRLEKGLADQSIWKLVFNQGARVFDLDQLQTRAMKTHIQLELGNKIARYKNNGFQYLYDSFRISDLTETAQECPRPFYDLHKFLNSPTFLSFCHEITGDETINYLDVQATRYRAGHFLTEHTDTADGLHRRFAFVLNMTPVWRPDWGGILLFLSDDSHIRQGFVPAYNCLNILKVPQRHCVSMVTPAAMGARISFTGWMRSLPDGPPISFS